MLRWNLGPKSHAKDRAGQLFTFKFAETLAEAPDKKRISMIDLSQCRPAAVPYPRAPGDVALGAAKRHIARVKYREARDLTVVED